MGATNTLFVVAKSRHTLLFLQPEHHMSWSLPLSLLQDFFLGLPRARGTPKREVTAPCAASSAKKAVSSMTLHYLLIQNDLRSLRRRRGCGKVHAPRQRRTSQGRRAIKNAFAMFLRSMYARARAFTDIHRQTVRNWQIWRKLA